MPKRVAQVLRLARPSVRQALPGLAAGVLSAGSAVALLATSAWLITRAAEQVPIMWLGLAIVGVRAFALSRAVFRYLERLASHDAAFRALGRVRAHVFDRIVPAAPAALGERGQGELLSRLVRDVDALQDYPLRLLQPVIVSGVVVASGIGLLAWFSPTAAGAVALCAILAVGLGWWLSAAMAASSDRALAPLRGELQEAMLGYIQRLDVLLAFDAVNSEADRIEVLSAHLQRAERRSALSVGLVSGLILLLGGAASVAALVLGIPEMALGSITGPELALLTLTPMAIFEILAQVVIAGGIWRRVRTAAQRVVDVVPEPLPDAVPFETERVTEADLAAEAAQDRRVDTLEVADLAARWPGREDTAVRGLSVRLTPGDCLLLTGPSGSGKSTLAAVLTRLLEYEGEYRINGVEARTLPARQVRNLIGLSQQRPHLFDASLRNNLNFAHEAADDAALWQVLARVGLAEWVRERGGLDMELGEYGALVSGGQAQRIALARVLLADFPVVVLDEPTANVQPELSQTLLEDILSAAKAAQRIVIVISHEPVDARLITQRLDLLHAATHSR